MSVYFAGTTAALIHTKHYFQKAGIAVTDTPRWDTEHLILDVPSFRPGCNLNIDTVLTSLPRNITVWGGNLDHAALDGYCCVDLLRREDYLLENARITAECTVNLIRPMLKNPWSDNNVMIIGYGRIGKFLVQMLSQTGCKIIVVSGSPSPIPGADKVSLDEAKSYLSMFDIIINTAPAAVLQQEDLAHCVHCLKIDLASVNGIDADDVIWARGLPGRYAPEQSGILIAQTVLRIMKEGVQ